MIVGDDWWMDRSTLLESRTHEAYVENLHGRRRDDDSWEYALIEWRYQVPNCIWVVHNGRMGSP